MTKKKFMAVLSTAAITTSLLATTAFAATPEEQNWNSSGGYTTGHGDGGVRMPVIEVEVPLELPFTVNPYKLNLAEEGQTAITDQIWSDNYMIINHSEVPVAVETSSFATAGTGITLESSITIDANTTKYTGATATDKNAFLGMQFAKSITSNANGEYDIKYDYTAWTPATGDDKTNLQAIGGLLLDSAVTSSAPAKATVVLSNETESNTTAGKNAAAFKYMGFVNDSTTSAYTDEDFKVTTVYTLSVLASDDIDTTNNTVKGYTATTGTDNAGTAWNAYKKTP